MLLSRDPDVFCFVLMAFMYLWPAATNVVARRPHQRKGVKRILVYESAFANTQRSGNFFAFEPNNSSSEKLRRKLIQF
tara:strand:- start:4224 stop:4457 length:234 start_codon:yes stop_codon:yes gene_type:complete